MSNALEKTNWQVANWPVQLEEVISNLGIERKKFFKISHKKKLNISRRGHFSHN